MMRLSRHTRCGTISLGDLIKRADLNMIKLPARSKDYSYDDWLEFFRKIPADQLENSQDELRNKIPVEGYAALSRWLEIIDNPSKMDKLYQGRLRAQAEAEIMDVAIGDDDEAVWIALIRKNAAQLDASTSSPQEVARLSQNLGIFRDKLHEIRARKPKKGSTLERVLEAAAKSATKSAKPAKKKATKVPKTAKNTKKSQKTAKIGTKTVKIGAKAAKTRKTAKPATKRPAKTPAKASEASKTIAKAEVGQNGS